MHQALQNKVAVVTGGSGVLCSEMAKELARQGMRVAILNRTAQKARQSSNRLKKMVEKQLIFLWMF